MTADSGYFRIKKHWIKISPDTASGKLDKLREIQMIQL